MVLIVAERGPGAAFFVEENAHVTPVVRIHSGGRLSPPAGRPRWAELRRFRHDRGRAAWGPSMQVTMGRPTCDEGLRPYSDAVADVAHAMVGAGRVVPGLNVEAEPLLAVAYASHRFSGRRAEGQRRAAARRSWPGSSRRSPPPARRRRSPRVRSGSVRQTCCRPRRRAHHHLRAGHPRRRRTCDLQADGSALRAAQGRLTRTEVSRGSKSAQTADLSFQ